MKRAAQGAINQSWWPRASLPGARRDTHAAMPASQGGISLLNRYRAAGLALLAFPIMLLVGAAPDLQLFHDIASYAGAHTVMVSFSMVVCGLVFASGWYTASGDRSGVMSLLSTAFLAVGLLDLGHLLSFGGMPVFVTPSGGDKALAFWLAARYVGALALLAIAVSPPRWETSRLQTYGFLSVALALVALTYWLILFRPADLPRLFIEGRGLTPLKIWGEYGVVGLHVATAAILAARGQRSTRFSITPLLAAMIVLAASEVAFTLYRTGYDNFNVTGHVYKIIGFALIYRVVFVEAVSEPFRLRAASEAALRRSQEHLARAQRIGHIGSVEYDFATDTPRWSDELYAILGLPPNAIEPSIENFAERVHPEDRARFVEALDRDWTDGDSEPTELRIVRPDGSIRRTLRRSEVVHTGEGGVRRLTVTFEDFTERKAAAEAREESERLLREAAENAKIGIYVHDHGTDQIRWSAEQREIFGVGPDEIVTLGLVVALVHPQDRERIAAAVRRAHDPAGDGRFDVEFRILRHDGAVRWVGTRGYTTFGGRAGDRHPLRTIGATIDMSERMQIEERLRRSETHLAQAQSVGRIGSSRVDPSADEYHWSAEYFRLLGLDPRTTVPSAAAFAGAIVPEDRAKLRSPADLLRVEGPIAPIELRVARADGEIRWLHRHAARITSSDGSPPSLLFTLQDVTDLKKAEEQRLTLERQLALAQRMETVGQLTGGVAHDFNNLLAVMLGRLRLLDEELAGNPELRDWARICIRAAERGASLTRSLLAFSRTQPLHPTVIELNAIVSDMADLLRRTLGETIEIELVATPDLERCMADPGQVQNALINLALNARDAMPAGGRLLIETSNTRLGADDAARTPETAPGEYVVLSVSDTGRGMSPETARRAFEPFFTTKGVGEGSGLGLSMVYGFAKQSGGHVSLYSELGRGTTVKLYLPSARGTDAPARPAEATAPIPSGSETILVVEDNDDMRDVTCEQLERLGYRVLAAGDAAAGQATLERHPDVALLLCDVVLGGGISGPEFARRAVERHPDLAVLFMSGYSGRIAAETVGAFDPAAVLPKPFGVEELARRVRAALDRASS